MQAGLRPFLKVDEDKSSAPSVTPKPKRTDEPAGAFFAQTPARDGDLDDNMMHMVCDHVGGKASQKFRTVKDAFRGVEIDFANRVDRSEVRNFFRNYGSKTKLADKFFDRLDPQRSGFVDFNEFRDCFAPYIQPGYHPPRPGESQKKIGLSEWGGTSGLAAREQHARGFAARPWTSRGSTRSNRSIMSEDEIQMNKYGRFEGITTYQMSFNPEMYKDSSRGRNR